MLVSAGYSDQRGVHLTTEVAMARNSGHELRRGAIGVGHVRKHQAAAAQSVALVHAVGQTCLRQQYVRLSESQDRLAVAKLVLDEFHRMAVLCERSDPLRPVRQDERVE